MYAQTIMQVLHHEGLVMNSLSASLWEEQSKAVRELLNTEDAEMLIMFISVGYYPGECLTTRSERKPAELVVI